MDEWLPTLQRFVAGGLALLLVMLRLEAERFSAAEYDEDARRPAAVGPPPDRLVRRRVRPDHRRSCSSTRRLARSSSSAPATTGVKTLVYGFLYGLIGAAVALGVALYRYHRVRLPDVWSYPGALVNAVSTALIDEVTFRGALLRAAARDRPEPDASPTSSRRSLYALATRLGAPGRNRYMLVMALARRARRRLGHGRHRRHRRRVPRPLDHAVRGLPRRRATPASSCRAVARRRRSTRSAGRRTAGASSGRGSRRSGIGDRGRSASARRRSTGRRRPPGRALHPHPVLRLGLPVLRLRRLRGCGRARAAQPRRGLLRALRGRARAARRRARRAVRAAGELAAARSTSVYLGGGTPSLVPADEIAGLLDTASGAGSASPPTPRSRSRRTRVPTSAATPPRSLGPGSPGCRSARRASTPPSCSGWAGGTGRPTSATPSRRRARPASARSTSISCTTCPAGPSRPG